jgi:hypothetical protein
MREECVRGAKFIAKLLESLGADVKVVRWVERGSDSCLLTHNVTCMCRPVCLVRGCT